MRKESVVAEDSDTAYHTFKEQKREKDAFLCDAASGFFFAENGAPSSRRKKRLLSNPTFKKPGDSLCPFFTKRSSFYEFLGLP